MNFKANIMDTTATFRSLARITHEIIERNRGAENVALIGIKRRGVPLARILAANIERFEGTVVPVGSIDIAMYRDDISDKAKKTEKAESSLPINITDKHIILVDDVIYTGRTVRAAIEALFSYGRPRSIQLAVLVDRGHRELPIRPDFVGKNIPTSKNEIISVKVDEYDGETGVAIYTI